MSIPWEDFSSVERNYHSPNHQQSEEHRGYQDGQLLRRDAGTFADGYRGWDEDGIRQCGGLDRQAALASPVAADYGGVERGQAGHVEDWPGAESGGDAAESAGCFGDGT